MGWVLRPRILRVTVPMEVDVGGLIDTHALIMDGQCHGLGEGCCCSHGVSDLWLVFPRVPQWLRYCTGSMDGPNASCVDHLQECMCVQHVL